jgi:hypothetical protein
MLSWYSAQIFSGWFWDGSTRPCYYWYHFRFYVAHALYFYCQILSISQCVISVVVTGVLQWKGLSGSHWVSATFATRRSRGALTWNEIRVLKFLNDPSRKSRAKKVKGVVFDEVVLLRTVRKPLCLWKKGNLTLSIPWRWGIEKWRHSVLSLTLYGEEWLTWRPDRFNLGERPQSRFVWLESWSFVNLYLHHDFVPFLP